MKHVLLALTLCLSLTAFAETWDIGETLQFTPGSEMDVTFQTLPDYSETENLIHGWKGDDLHYVVLIDQQSGGKKHSKYWKGLMREMKSQSDNKKVEVLAEGSMNTDAGSEVSYKLFSWLSEGETTVQMSSLIVGKKYAYWLLSTPFSDDVDYMVAETKLLIKAVTIKQ